MGTTWRALLAPVLMLGLAGPSALAGPAGAAPRLAAAGVAPAPAAAGGWTWPLAPPPAVLRGFEPPPRPWDAGHRGVDLAGSPGQPVLAAGPGRIGFAGVIAGVGVVTVVHGALRTTYQPVSTRRREGEVVAAGEPIGRLSPVGGHCAPVTCLHWGLLRGRDYLDPLALLGRARLRLLPLSGAGPPPVGLPLGV